MVKSQRIVVGHDGSEYSDTALRWALEYAKVSGGSVTVVRAWTLAKAPTPATKEPGYVPPASDFADAVASKLQSDVAPVIDEYPGVSVDYEPVRGKAVEALLSAAESADLMIIGPRGLGGVKGLVLGSVSADVVKKAPCTVVIAR